MTSLTPRPIPATQARMTRVARNPSVSMEPYPTNWASLSDLICLEEVPEETRQWKPETAPQAIVMKRKGKSQGASGTERNAGATTSRD